MAKKKMAQEKRKMGRPATGRLSVVLTIKGLPEWRAWLGEFADEERITPTELIDRALKAYAKAKKRTEPPMRRRSKEK